MYQRALASAATFARESGSPYDVIRSPRGAVTTVGEFTASDLYPGQSIYRVFPNGDVLGVGKAS